MSMNYHAISGQVNPFEHIWVDKNGRPMQQDYPDKVNDPAWCLEVSNELRVISGLKRGRGREVALLISAQMIEYHDAGIPYDLARELLIRYHEMILKRLESGWEENDE